MGIEYQFVLVGALPLAPAFKARVSASRLDGRRTVVDSRKDVEKWGRAFYTFLMPYFFEGESLALLEA